MSDVVPILRVDRSRSTDDFDIAAARAIAETIATATQERGGCLVALSGGRTPEGVYRRLGDLLRARPVDANRLHIVFADERLVPPADPDSNYGMVARELVSRIAIPPEQVHRIRGEMPPEAAASDYERELEKVLPLFFQRCDLVLLGVGEDGHTASLFPGTEVLHESHRTAREVFAKPTRSWRVTLTLPVINGARAVLFLATGKHKAAIVARVLGSSHANDLLPATMVNPDSGTLTWMLDADAASLIPEARRQ